MGGKKTREQRTIEVERKEIIREAGNKTHVLEKREVPGRTSKEAKNILNIAPDDRPGTIARREGKPR